MSAHDDATRALELVRQISPILHGQGAAVQFAVLADLFAKWLAGHQGEGAERYREVAIAHWLVTVRELISVKEKMLLERLPTEGKQ